MSEKRRLLPMDTNTLSCVSACNTHVVDQAAKVEKESKLDDKEITIKPKRKNTKKPKAVSAYGVPITDGNTQDISVEGNQVDEHNEPSVKPKRKYKKRVKVTNESDNQKKYPFTLSVDNKETKNEAGNMHSKDLSIEFIDELNRLEKLDVKISERAAILSMNLSMDGSMLATFSVCGSVKIWELDNYELIQDLRDENVRGATNLRRAI
jgi:hypothetical protein